MIFMEFGILFVVELAELYCKSTYPLNSRYQRVLANFDGLTNTVSLRVIEGIRNSFLNASILFI